MKNSKILIFLLFFWSCDEYSDTRIFFSSDKSEYIVGDDLILILNIETSKQKKNIKLYSDLNNLEIDGLLKYKGNTNEKNKYKIKKIRKNMEVDRNFEIQRHSISFDNPLKFKIIGKIKQNDTSYIIDFPSLKTQFYVNKKDYLEAELFGFEGFFEPINPPFGYSYEDFLDFYPIVIKE